MSDWRRAGAGDAAALADLERDANLLALGHVFGNRAFPYDGVLARWVDVLADPAVTTRVVDGDGRLHAVTAYDAVRLRHVVVHPDVWGRRLGTEAVRLAVADGATRLWVLEANHRARGLYERLGWRPTGREQVAEWPPHPREIEYAATEPNGTLPASQG